MKGYTPLKWYLLQQVRRLLLVLQAELPEQSSEEGFTPIEDEVFELWQNSEFAEIFIKQLSRGSLKKASAFAARAFDRHIVILGERHILRTGHRTSGYHFQPSLGEYEEGKKVRRLLETTLRLDGKELRLLSFSMAEMKRHAMRIEKAISLISTHSPDSGARLRVFTDTIVPIRERQLVSYSHQELPGTSMINLYHRDFVDLLDDLLHENGHHHLNYYLNLTPLIQEPLENIYYSPWREKLRPLRGIYHAYFTFFWAFKLFLDLGLAGDKGLLEEDFKAPEIRKIRYRALEEFHMLQYTYADLLRARRSGLIADAGWALIQEQQRILLRSSKKIVAWEDRLGPMKKQLRDLRKQLARAKQQYR